MQNTAIQIYLTKVLVGMQFLAPSGTVYTVNEISGSDVILDCERGKFTRNIFSLKSDMQTGKWQRVNQGTIK